MKKHHTFNKKSKFHQISLKRLNSWFGETFNKNSSKFHVKKPVLKISWSNLSSQLIFIRKHQTLNKKSKFHQISLKRLNSWFGETFNKNSSKFHAKKPVLKISWSNLSSQLIFMRKHQTLNKKSKFHQISLKRLNSWFGETFNKNSSKFHVKKPVWKISWSN